MQTVFKMALKDLKLLFRDKMGAFFIVVFPILMGVFFGLMTSGTSNGDRSKIDIAIVDQDQSPMSETFIANLNTNEGLKVEVDELESARQSVRLNQRVAMLVVPEGFGEKAGVFWGEPATVQLGVDPSRSAESGMLQGLVMESIGQLAGERFSNPSQMKEMIANQKDRTMADEEIDPVSKGLLQAFFGSLDSMVGTMDRLQENEEGRTEGTGGGFQFARIESVDVTRQIDPKSQQGQIQKISSRWDISFPQAMMWGILGCVAGFAISIARETTMGTMTRLKAAPISRFQILAGKALACLITVIGVILFLTTVGVLLGMQPKSYPMLALATICVSFCFVGIMMAFSVLGKTEQSVSGVGWAINMVMAMLGGCMIPVMFMPGFMKSLSVLSPIRWGILAIEGAIWREFTLVEMLMPCGILIAVGAVGIAIGTAVLKRRV